MAGFPPGLYSTSYTVRQHVSDMVDTVMSGGHSDELDSSLTTLHLSDTDDESVSFHAVGPFVWCYYGENPEYPLTRVSELRIDDRMLSAQGHIGLSQMSRRVIEGLSNAIDEKRFKLNGTIDCCNAYFRRENLHYDNLNTVAGDKLLPYYFTHESPIRGSVEYDAYHSDGDEDMGVGRRIIIVYVKETGDLTGHIPNGIVVYLGGDHSESNIVHDKQGFNSKSLKFSQYFHRRETGDAIDSARVFISSPFENTTRGETEGANVAVAELRNGHYIYWATDEMPREGYELDKLEFATIPLHRLTVTHESIAELVAGGELHNALIGVWVLRGIVLSGIGNQVECPVGVMARFRGGFFRVKLQQVQASMSIRAKMQRTVSSFERLGSAIFGFEDVSKGAYRCDFNGFCTFLKVPESAMAAYIGGNGSAAKYFAPCSFAGREMRGPIQLTGKVEVDSWISGNVELTGCGLAFLCFGSEYRKIETSNGLTKLVPYDGGGIETRSDEGFGSHIALQ